MTSAHIVRPTVVRRGVLESHQLVGQPTRNPAAAQETLGISFDEFTGMPAVPHLQVVTHTANGVEQWAARFAQAVVEVVAGDRPVPQLLRCTTAEVYHDLSRRASVLHRAVPPTQRLRKVRAMVRSVHVYCPRATAAEVSVHVRHGERSRAIAARLEFREGRWQCVALEFG
ncbi:MAG: Rv3235 family protein [Marmoricola sp.]